MLLCTKLHFFVTEKHDCVQSYDDFRDEHIMTISGMNLNLVPRRSSANYCMLNCGFCLVQGHTVVLVPGPAGLEAGAGVVAEVGGGGGGGGRGAVNWRIAFSTNTCGA